MNKKILVIGIAMFFLAVLLAGSVDAVCCEKLKSGAWCMNVIDESSCVESINPATGAKFRSSPQSCEATSYCASGGTCIDSTEGTCIPSSEATCKANKGYFDPKAADEISQCQLGCCIIGDGASFVTQAKCNYLSSFYGTGNTFRRDVTDQLECFALAAPEEKGACVEENEAGRTCTIETKQACQEKGAEFSVGYMCTAKELNTNCAKTRKTTCISERDEVYYLDSCGNIANIYDSSKYDNEDYWTYIKEWDESCKADDVNGNAGSQTCGNCDYQAGSTCGTPKGENKKPVHGNKICTDLSCEYGGVDYQHGESWCITNTKGGLDEDLPGSEHFRLSCYNAEVSLDNSDSARQKVCIQTEIEGTTRASWSASIWQDCPYQNNKEDCEDIETRDCEWVDEEIIRVNVWSGKAFDKPAKRDRDIGQAYTFGNYPPIDQDGESVDNEGICIPKYTPGFASSNEDLEVENVCFAASASCTIKLERYKVEGLWGGSWKCTKNCECLTDDWQEKMSEMCIALGDCGNSTNFIGVKGYGEQVNQGGGPECSDGIDNDGDGDTDYPADKTCADEDHDSETYTSEEIQQMEEERLDQGDEGQQT
ncbi:hypothetical protein ACFLZJ_00905 [Nanoarchaeota archaeon]